MLQTNFVWAQCMLLALGLYIRTFAQYKLGDCLVPPEFLEPSTMHLVQRLSLFAAVLLRMSRVCVALYATQY